MGICDSKGDHVPVVPTSQLLAMAEPDAARDGSGQQHSLHRENTESTTEEKRMDGDETSPKSEWKGLSRTKTRHTERPLTKLKGLLYFRTQEVRQPDARHGWVLIVVDRGVGRAKMGKAPTSALINRRH